MGIGNTMPDAKPNVVPLERLRLGEAADLLADAFFDDPFASYMIPDQSKRRRTVSRMMGRCMSYGMLYGHVDNDRSF